MADDADSILERDPFPPACSTAGTRGRNCGRIQTRFGLLTAVFLAACSGPSGPSDAEITRRHNRAAALMDQYRFDKAVGILKKLVKARPESTELQVDLAVALVNRRGPDDERRATKRLERIVEKHPDHLRARYVLAAIRHQSGKTEKALRHFRTVAKADPDDAHAAYYVGQCLAKLEKWEKALRWLRRAMDADPYLASAYHQAQFVFAQVGRKKRAAAMLKKFRTLRTDNPLARTADLTRYRKMGPKAQVGRRAEDGESVSPPEGPLFEPPTPIADG